MSHAPREVAACFWSHVSKASMLAKKTIGSSPVGVAVAGLVVAAPGVDAGFGVADFPVADDFVAGDFFRADGVFLAGLIGPGLYHGAREAEDPRDSQPRSPRLS
ncbi:hypothetical protein [Myxococcus llanfairpwllgwyngyllgogerychwyrndrobwllllantysiliogogogochensis]|uniref:hypothetical protein n=1 Tax=Myxococcus llanfairpwllgwyngyllgogerychwyrndrobwllllantysiliogogogochensis TaxID=2590453 RepID=UPI001FE8CBFF|nr:hypothetical protein [Myxococcus llanfairpwllgwyngyllgogerychwyrndrobwllllantysiliogogogochensis]